MAKFSVLILLLPLLAIAPTFGFSDLNKTPKIAWSSACDECQTVKGLRVLTDRSLPFRSSNALWKLLRTPGRSPSWRSSSRHCATKLRTRKNVVCSSAELTCFWSVSCPIWPEIWHFWPTQPPLLPLQKDAHHACQELHICANRRLEQFHRVGLLYARKYQRKEEGAVGNGGGGQGICFWVYLRGEEKVLVEIGYLKIRGGEFKELIDTVR